MALRKIGDWEKAGNLIGNLSKEIVDARDLALKRWGLKAEGLAKQHMSKQDLPWAPLKPSTIAAKLRKGYSENILIATSDYFQAITSWHEGNTVYAGVRKEAKNRDGDQIHDIAALHEFGSKSGSLPARELWKPVFSETMAWFSKRENQPAQIFLKRVKAKYGV